MQNQPSSSKNVFISFRGEDTCDGFTHNLYKALSDQGIKTFMDDKENEITPSLVKVIQECKIAIIIFSENYASSSFCLEVLSFIVDNFLHNHKNRFIFPFFYNIDPSHVRNQSGPYQTAFSKHEERLKENKEKVLKWRSAVSQVAGFSSGWHFESGFSWDGSEFELIDKIVEVVSREFGRVHLYNTDYTVGLDSRLGEVYQHLELESKEVLMVGIYGIGGIGKTTLKLSYELLDLKEKSIFLDITCCFIGYELTDVENILGARYGDDMKYHIQRLIDNSLINISLDGKVISHPLVESMGKEIVREESPEDPGRRSRLWLPEDIVQVLQNTKGTSNIEIIHLNSPLTEDEEAIEWDGMAFKEMPNLRILIIRKCRFSKAPKYLPNSLKILEWWRYPSEELPSDFDLKKLVICKILNIGFMSPKPTEILQISHQAETTWRLVGLMSSVVGLSCYALSPSFNRLIGKWKAFKFIIYGGLSLAILTTIFFAKQSSLSTRHVHLKTYTSFLVLMIISVYSFFYDRAVNGKPEILSIVSNAAFALVSLSLHKLISFGFEIGVFSYFLGCFVVQLLTINWMLISVAIIFGYPLYCMHSSLNSRPEVASGGQVIHSSSHFVDIPS